MTKDIQRVRDEIGRYRRLLEQTTDDHAVEILRALIEKAQRRLTLLASAAEFATARQVG